MLKKRLTRLVLSLSTATAMAAAMAGCSAVSAPFDPDGTFIVGVVNIGSDFFFFEPPGGRSVELQKGETSHVALTGANGEKFDFHYQDAVGNQFTATCTLKNVGEQLFIPREVDINLNTGLFHCIEWD